MPSRPDRPKIYHIIHVDRLSSVIADASLWCDREIETQARPGTTIGMGSIKGRRLSLPVPCHPGDRVGDYVPFYFCPRSIMLYVIHCANHPELNYRGGQGPIVHLEADLMKSIAWADGQDRRWAFSLSNAGASYSKFRFRIEELSQVDWAAVAATDFREPDIKEGKQAEFPVHRSFPWELVDRVGVATREVAQRAADAIRASPHRPVLEIRRDWYY